MPRVKIDYGIDLGTTNSAICKMVDGVPRIIKTDTSKDILPSCVYINKKKKSTSVGDTAYNAMKSDKRKATKKWQIEESSTYIEFKRYMGTDQLYESSIKGEKVSYTPEQLSAEVLKALKSFVTGENLKSIVITVPAKFTVNQKTATIEAACLAGFEHCELLQEPIAASYAYGIGAEVKDGYWLVFDFGGGTFDAALLRAEDGIMQIFDTEGNNYLGGKNLDYAIVDDIIVPELEKTYNIQSILHDNDKYIVLRDAMKTYAEEIKNQLSFKEEYEIITDVDELGCDDDGIELELDMTFTQQQVFAVMRPVFQKAIDICKELLERNNMRGSQLDKLILVGGPTHSPLIREMIKEQLTPNIDTSVDPMTAVAIGAALYSSTLDANVKASDIEMGTVMLSIDYDSTSVDESEWVAIRYADEQPSQSVPTKLYVELVRADKAWSSGKNEIGKNSSNVIEAFLVKGKPNSFHVIAYDEFGSQIKCFPEEITIIQSAKVGAPVLPYNIALEIWDPERSKMICEAIEELKKNRPLPAVGTSKRHKTTSALRPGVETDKLVIPVYQADAIENGVSSKLYEYVANVIITGEDINQLIPEGTDTEVTMKVNTSEVMSMTVSFPSMGITVTKELNTSKKHSLEEAKNIIEDNFKEAQRNLDSLTNAGIDTSDLQECLSNLKNMSMKDSETKMILEEQKRIMREIETRESETEFDRVEKELRRLFKMTAEDQKKYGDFQTSQRLEALRTEVDDAISKRDVEHAKNLINDVRQLDYDLALVEYMVAWVMNWHNNFEKKGWSNPNRARQLVNQALEIINDAPTVEKLKPIVIQLFDMLPNNEQPKEAQGRLGR